MHFSRYLRNAAAVVAITVALGAPAWAAAPSGITSPKDAFGHDIGDDYFLANYTQLEAYFKTLAGQSDRMKLVDIGPTEEGRREYMAIVSSPALVSGRFSKETIPLLPGAMEGAVIVSSQTLRPSSRISRCSS